MNRLVLLVAVAFLPLLGAQDRQVLPPGPPPGPTEGTAWLVDALFVQANMVEGGQVLFLVPHADETVPPSVLVKVDGKAVRAFGTDRKPLDITELNKRLSVRAAAVVVHGQPPDPFFLKALNDRSVVFVVAKKLFDQMAKMASAELLPGWWNVMKAGEKANTPSGDHWIIEEKIAVHRGGKLDGYMSYKADATDYPKTIDLTPDRGPAKGKVLKGIYHLDANTLKVCYVSPDTADPEKADRPKEFGAKGTITLVFGRVVP
jgi:uncharacterized protein (TIGR03067 family)